MGYDLHITRRENWFDDGPDITPEEWLGLVRSDPEMRNDGFAEATVGDGAILRMDDANLCAWTAHPEAGEWWFNHSNGNIVVKNPDQAAIGKMFRISQILAAKVQGDDGEIYDQWGDIQSNTYNGWRIYFRKNVHMYTHSLKAEKNAEVYDIPCEDTPSDFIAIWPYPLSLDEPVLLDLLLGLREWAEQTGLTYRLYKAKDDYQTNISVSAVSGESSERQPEQGSPKTFPLRRSTMWAAINLVGMVAFLRLAAEIWVLPGEEHFPGGPGDPFYWFFVLVPFQLGFLIANLIVLFLIFKRRSESKSKVRFYVWGAVAILWLLVVRYDHNRSYREITEIPLSTETLQGGNNFG